MGNINEMHEVIICPECKKQEYYGMMRWRDGRTYCRRCIYEMWARESDYRWDASKEYAFPLYDDGLNYVKEG
jgi:hypothetical protein